MAVAEIWTKRSKEIEEAAKHDRLKNLTALGAFALYVVLFAAIIIVGMSGDGRSLEANPKFSFPRTVAIWLLIINVLMLILPAIRLVKEQEKTRIVILAIWVAALVANAMLPTLGLLLGPTVFVGFWAWVGAAVMPALNGYAVLRLGTLVSPSLRRKQRGLGKAKTMLEKAKAAYEAAKEERAKAQATLKQAKDDAASAEEANAETEDEELSAEKAEVAEAEDNSTEVEEASEEETETDAEEETSEDDAEEADTDAEDEDEEEDAEADEAEAEELSAEEAEVAEAEAEVADAEAKVSEARKELTEARAKVKAAKTAVAEDATDVPTSSLVGTGVLLAASLFLSPAWTGLMIFIVNPI